MVTNSARPTGGRGRMTLRIAVLAIAALPLAGCATPYGYSRGAWAYYDGDYDWGYDGYDRPYTAPYAAPPPDAYYGGAYYGGAYYGNGGGYAPPPYGPPPGYSTYYTQPGNY